MPNQTEDETIFNKYCKGYKYISPIIGRKSRIVAIGDLHGDLKLAKDCLKLAKCIDDNDNWIGNDTYIVQVGDQVDSCRPVFKKCNDETVSDEPNDIELLVYFTELDKKAIKYNGRVISLLGNHELMNVLGDMRYVSSKSSKNDKFKDENDRIEQFKPGNSWAKYLGCTRISSVIIGDFIFVHAGFIPKFMKDAKINNRNDLIKLNSIIRKWLLGVIDDDLNDKQYIKTIVNGNPSSMFWDRILGALPQNLKMFDEHGVCKTYLKDALDIFGVKSMVIGHTPQFHPNKLGIQMTCQNNKYPMHGLYRIDFGGSYAFNMLDGEYVKTGHIMEQRSPQILEILYENPNDMNDIPIVNILK